jgi:hypothetical protein
MHNRKTGKCAMTTDAVFIIEGGKALSMVQNHISECIRVQSNVNALARELGITEGRTDRTNGVLMGVVFPATIHADFTKPKKRNGASYPKKNTPWAQRFSEQKGYQDPAKRIAQEFSIPLVMNYHLMDSGRGVGSGSSCMGSMLVECGFLYLSEQGPYAMWTPDVPGLVAARATSGITIDEPAASFKLEFEGCRRIAQEEWETLVLQHELQERIKNGESIVHKDR